MSDEELAKLNIYFVRGISALDDLHFMGLDGKYYKNAKKVEEANLKWLQQEVEE